ncbi:MAG: DUF2953 domain-containing protein [Sedimentibacter sp.]|nr:DUF2953 domain-containing protein [Sedimentibacter sp.]
MLILKILFIIFVIITIILAVILLPPYTYLIKGDNIAGSKVDISVIWLFGRMKINFVKYFKGKSQLTFTIFGFSKENTIKKNARAKHKEEKYSKEKIKDKNALNLFNSINREVIQNLITLINNIWKEIKPDDVYINAKIGFNDPMCTGLLYAISSQFSNSLNSEKIQIHPTFEEETIKGKILLSGRVWLLYLLIVIVKFLLSPAVRKELIKIIKKRRKSKCQKISALTTT